MALSTFRRAAEEWRRMNREADALLRHPESREMILSGSAKSAAPSHAPAPRPASSAERIKAIRAAERQRCKAIIMSVAGERAPTLARQLALDGDLSVSDAIVLLEMSPDREIVAKATAEGILAVAKFARDGGPERALPPRGTLARQIIEAGKNRRGEI
jgi:hypothetical protein